MKTSKMIFAGLLIFLCLSKVANAGNAQFSARPDSFLIHSINGFGFDLYKNSHESEKNLFISPFSISTALAMAYVGAGGKTLEEMKNVLKLKEKDSIVARHFLSVLKNLSNKQVKDSLILYTANSFWAQQDYLFLKTYTDLLTNYFFSTAFNVNFIKDPEKCRADINKWVATYTENKITELIPKGFIDELTRLVLVNAVYFNAKWEIKFNPERTKKGWFFITEKDSIETSFMHAELLSLFFENEQFALVELPYYQNRFSMLILLPKTKFGLWNIMKDTEYEYFSGKILSHMSLQSVVINLPKFNIAYETELSEMLSRMGMKTAFSDDADFSGMTGNKDLKISKVIHKSFIDVNEEGTEAVAATAVVVRIKSAPPSRNILRADHPFMFLIRDNESGLVLFMGNVYNPSGNESR